MADCVYCGEWTGDHVQDPYESCGARKCERFIRDEIEAEKDRAHEEVEERFRW